MRQVTLRYIEGCPSWRAVDDDLRQLAAELGFELRRERVVSAQHAEQLGFPGSPTVLVDGRDPFAAGDEPGGLACRVYATPEGQRGAPTWRQLRAALEDAR